MSVAVAQMNSKPWLYEKLSCPVCGARVINGRSGIHPKLCVLETYSGKPPEFSAKCMKCKKTIGIGVE
jgi:DNA-directed RNA polymerase subunit RPC12/RpoP